MRRIVSVIIISCVLLPLSAAAQEVPSLELFEGYSHLRTGGGKGLHGWNSSITLNLNRWDWLGVVFNASGHYGSETLRLGGPGRPFIDTDTNIHSHSVLAGPRLSYRKSETVTPFVQALFGAAFSNADDRVSAPGLPLNFPDLGVSPALAMGGGLDVRISRSFAVRAIQAEYLVTRFDDGARGNARISTGLVIRLY